MVGWCFPLFSPFTEQKPARKFGIDYDIFAGLKTPGFIKVLTKADLVLMTTTEDRAANPFLPMPNEILIQSQTCYDLFMTGDRSIWMD